MKKKFSAIGIALVLALSLMLVPAAVSADGTPTIDGVISSGEWDDYFWLEDTDIPSFQAYVTGDDDYLYIAISSSGLEYGDMLIVNIDANHNHKFDSDGTDFYLGALVDRVPYYYRSGVGRWNRHDGDMIAQGFLIKVTDSQAEFQIPRNQLLSDTVGFQLIVWDRSIKDPSPPYWGNRYPGEGDSMDMAHPNYGDLALVKVEKIEIDIKPGSDPNSINLKSKGVVPVAVLTTEEDFDASNVDPNTVQFAGAEPVRWTTEDVDSDGDLDMLFHFKTQDLELTETSTEAILTGETVDEQPIEGTDTVNIVPKKGK